MAKKLRMEEKVELEEHKWERYHTTITKEYTAAIKDAITELEGQSKLDRESVLKARNVFQEFQEKLKVLEQYYHKKRSNDELFDTLLSLSH